MTAPRRARALRQASRCRGACRPLPGVPARARPRDSGRARRDEHPHDSAAARPSASTSVWLVRDESSPDGRMLRLKTWRTPAPADFLTRVTRAAGAPGRLGPPARPTRAGVVAGRDRVPGGAERVQAGRPHPGRRHVWRTRPHARTGAAVGAPRRPPRGTCARPGARLDWQRERDRSTGDDDSRSPRLRHARCLSRRAAIRPASPRPTGESLTSLERRLRDVQSLGVHRPGL